MGDRYARQRLIEWWDQDRLRQSRVLVAGAGALGNELLKNLALLGVGHLLIVDFDRIESSNLSRTVLFDANDIGRPKVDAAARALKRLNSEIEVETIDGDLFYDVGLGYYRHSDLVLGCLDSLAARSQVGHSCVLAGIPYLDGGMWSLGGEVRWFTGDDGPCFDCTLSANDRARADERRSCSGFREAAWDELERVPTVVSTAATIGGLLAQETAKWLCRYPIQAGKAIVYNGQALTMHRSQLARNPECPSDHVPYENVSELPWRAAEKTARQILARARADLAHGVDLTPVQDGMTVNAGDAELLLELGRDFLLSLRCPDCGQYQEVNRAWGKVLESERRCPRPQCGAVRSAEVIRALSESSPYIDRPLASLGVPAGEVLVVRAPHGLLFYELTADVVDRIR